MKRIYGTIRNLLISGFIFLIPIAIAIVIVGKFWGLFLRVGNKLSKLLLIDEVVGPHGDAIMALFLFVIICVLAGFLLRFAFFRKLGEWIDDKIGFFFADYNEFRKTRDHTIAEKRKDEVFHTCLVQTKEYWIPAYIIDEADNGDITVFIPVAPDYDTGQVAIVPLGSYKRLNIDSRALNTFLKQFGKGIKLSVTG